MTLLSNVLNKNIVYRLKPDPEEKKQIFKYSFVSSLYLSIFCKNVYFYEFKYRGRKSTKRNELKEFFLRHRGIKKLELCMIQKH